MLDSKGHGNSCGCNTREQQSCNDENDSTGAAVQLTSDNDETTSGQQFYDFAWGVTGPTTGLNDDTATAGLGVFAGSPGIIASFKPN